MNLFIRILNAKLLLRKRLIVTLFLENITLFTYSKDETA
jgi:hypothetical protein